MTSPDSSELQRQTPPRSAGNLGPDVATEMQALFLVRLRSQLEKRYGPGSQSLDDTQRKILDRGIYSTFCDCSEVHVAEQAHALLQELRGT